VTESEKYIIESLGRIQLLLAIQVTRGVGTQGMPPATQGWFSSELTQAYIDSGKLLGELEPEVITKALEELRTVMADLARNEIP